jgi:pimeloyl-ACP methyl ester carboxylesterase/DNA-binding SARP family transcriptional activator
MTVRIRLTDRLAVENGDTLLDAAAFPARQGRLAFAYLAANRRSIPRNELAEQLWRDTLPKSWERDLSAVVSKLRATLAPLEGTVEIASAFGCYELRVLAGTEVDIDEALAAAHEAEAALADGDAGRAWGAANVAVTIARRPFLPGEDSPWLDAVRERLVLTLVRAINVLADVDASRGDLDGALRYAREAAALEPFRERSCIRLMRLHLAAGDRAEAVRDYSRCRMLLAEELGVEPSPEMESVYLEALGREPASSRISTGTSAVAATGAPEVPAFVTEYATTSGSLIAYQTVGRGPVDVVLVMGFASNLDLNRELPYLAEILSRLSALGRLILFDKRGTGLSDRADGTPSLDERSDDLGAVLDAAGCDRAAVVALGEGGPVAVNYAVRHPERITHLVLWETFARLMPGPGYEMGIQLDALGDLFADIGTRWGTGDIVRTIVSQDAPDDTVINRAFARYERNLGTPNKLGTTFEFLLHCDARDLLPSVTTPTLVLHRRGDPVFPVACGRYLAENIPDAKYVELAGDFVLSSTGADGVVLDEIERFVTSVP